jgi:predicted alpha/beta-hydrolase family hydrolase
MQNSLNARMIFQETGDSQSVLHVLAHANGQRLHSTIQQIAFERRGNSANSFNFPHIIQ